MAGVLAGVLAGNVGDGSLVAGLLVRSHWW